MKRYQRQIEINRVQERIDRLLNDISKLLKVDYYKANDFLEDIARVPFYRFRVLYGKEIANNAELIALLRQSKQIYDSLDEELARIEAKYQPGIKTNVKLMVTLQHLRELKRRGQI